MCVESIALEEKRSCATKKKVPTGVKGLDEMLGGGLPRGRCILVCGGPGSGKTILGVQFLYSGAVNYGENGLYISLDESETHLKENMIGFGWDLERQERAGKLRIVDASPIRKIDEGIRVGDINVGKQDFRMFSLIEAMKRKFEEIDAERIVVDPIISLILQYPDAFERRNAILELFEVVTKLGITTLLTTELRATALEREVQAEEFLSHGVIVFHTFTESGRMVRAIQIEKMRGIAHDNELRPYKITKNGIEVFPKESILLRT